MYLQRGIQAQQGGTGTMRGQKAGRREGGEIYNPVLCSSTQISYCSQWNFLVPLLQGNTFSLHFLPPYLPLLYDPSLCSSFISPLSKSREEKIWPSHSAIICLILPRWTREPAPPCPGCLGFPRVIPLPSITQLSSLLLFPWISFSGAIPSSFHQDCCSHHFQDGFLVTYEVFMVKKSKHTVDRPGGW